MSDTSRLSSLSNHHNHNETKCSIMQQFIKAVSKYSQCNTEENSFAITRSLQGLSCVTDATIFNPNTQVCTQFFINLDHLLQHIDNNSSFAWYIIDVLCNACHNPDARNALIHTYQFVPSLARLLGDHLTKDKRIRLLKLLQDLTCGIKMSWQIPHLVHLLKTLALWIESDDQMIVTLSVGTLANLCHQNLPAIYTLMANVDLKRMLRICASLEGGDVEIHTCRLLIILNGQEWNESLLTKMLHASFTAALEAFNARNRILLNQIVDFFTEIAENNKLADLLSANFFEQRFTELLAGLRLDSSQPVRESDDDCRLFECVSLVLDFIRIVVRTKSPLASKRYGVIIDIALQWIESKQTSSQSLRLLNDILSVDNLTLNDDLSSISSSLPVLTILLRSEVSNCLNQTKKITGLLKLFTKLLNVSCLRNQALQELPGDYLKNMFQPLLESDPLLPISLTSDLIDLFVHACVLINEITKYDTKWSIFQKEILNNPQIHVILARGLYFGSKEIISSVLDLCQTPQFPRNNVTDIMHSLQRDVIPNKSPRGVESCDIKPPLFGIAQLQQIDDVLKRLTEAGEVPGSGNAALSDVMQLYEYKLVSSGHSERVAWAGLEAASERCRDLQHCNAELSSTLERHHQLLYHAQQCADRRGKEASAAIKEVETLNKRLVQSELLLSNITKKLETSEESNRKLDEQVRLRNEAIQTLEETANKWERVAQKAQNNLRAVNEECHQFKTVIEQKDGDLKRSEDQIMSLEQELVHKIGIIDTITKVAMSQKK